MPLSTCFVIVEKNFEHSCDQVLSEWNFRKKITTTATEVILIQLFSYTVVSKQKIKMKTRNTMPPSYYPKVTSTQNKISIHDFYSFDQKKVASLSTCLLPTHKKKHTYLTDIQYSRYLLKKYSRLQHLSQSGHLHACKTPGFFFCLMLKFPISSLPIPSSSSSTTTIFYEGLSSSIKTWFSLKIKLER